MCQASPKHLRWSSYSLVHPHTIGRKSLKCTSRRIFRGAEQSAIAARSTLNDRARACSPSHAARAELLVDMRSSLRGHQIDEIEDGDHLRTAGDQHSTRQSCVLWDSGWGDGLARQQSANLVEKGSCQLAPAKGESAIAPPCPLCATSSQSWARSHNNGQGQHRGGDCKAAPTAKRLPRLYCALRQAHSLRSLSPALRGQRAWAEQRTNRRHSYVHGRKIKA
jgi:hypothetical protein